ncbi:rhodanese-like domain-containing protein [Oceanicoccus sp. KOV_DT_Chl]|uniref:rhodanese-like domain-containing protein n=1 Tax=Oceanicoccus sp. KOV_DT_Chl TaxID=1904639 RepID=UPI000C7D20B4|nr:rhodanese-like domain-containing protein [Oceanicoccus sp. KOV_DT_Chl]
MSQAVINATTFLEDIYPLANTLIIDVRTPAEFKSLHLPNSKNFPLDQLHADAYAELLSTAAGTTLYLLCGTGKRAQLAKEKLSDHMDNPIIIITGGINEIARSNVVLNSSDGTTISLERQVRIAAGALVVLGVVLSITLNPSLLALSAAVGLGLIFAGITDSCGMGLVLSKMPWNQ